MFLKVTFYLIRSFELCKIFWVLEATYIPYVPSW